jgi:hypothetical protein
MPQLLAKKGFPLLVFLGFLIIEFCMDLVGRGTMDHHSVGPGLTRMHAEALGALEPGGIRGATLSTEGAGFVKTGNGVAMDITTPLFGTGRGHLTETGNGDLLFRLGREYWRAGAVGVVVVVVGVVRLGRQLEAARRDPDTCGLIVRIGDDTLTGFRRDSPAYGVEPSHHSGPRIVCQSGGVITIVPVGLQCVGPGLRPESLFREEGALNRNNDGSIGRRGRSGNQQITPENVPTAHGGVDRIIQGEEAVENRCGGWNRSYDLILGIGVGTKSCKGFLSTAGAKRRREVRRTGTGGHSGKLKSAGWNVNLSYSYHCHSL